MNEILKGKTAAFLGDSICMASTFDKEHQWWGWAGRIDRDYGFASYVNKGCDGASVSDCRKQNRVIFQLERIKDQNFDYLMLHGGVNDAWDSREVGQMTDSFDVKDFDISTYAGGLEELFYTAKKYFPETKIGFIVNFRSISTIGRLSDMTEYFETAKKICEKWNIPYLDLFFDDDFNENVLEYKTKNKLADYIHPNSAGYDVLYPRVAEFMCSL
jgi:hypothetical protein